MSSVKDLIDEHTSMQTSLGKIQNLLSYLDEWISVVNQTIPEESDSKDIVINALEQAKLDLNVSMTTKAQELVEVEETDLDNAENITIVKSKVMVDERL